MVNHFATLLANISLKEYNYLVGKYALSTNKDTFKVLAIPNMVGAYISLNKTFAYPEITDYQAMLLNQDYVKIELPIALQKFHNLIFPPENGIRYNQFLLYCYLKLIDSTIFSEEIKKYDNRITYHLNEIEEYFGVARVSNVTSTQDDYNLLVFGLPETPTNPEYLYDVITIRQVPNTANVLVYSAIDRKYYKNGYLPSLNSDEMQIALTTASPEKNITLPIKIGNTGLSFSIGGNLEGLSNSSNFVSSTYKTWRFSIEYKLHFNFSDKLNEITMARQTLEDMLNYSRDLCNVSYENIWHNHFNAVYRFSGLLLAYVERMNFVWAKKLT